MPEVRPRPARSANEAPRPDTPERQARRKMMEVIGSGQDRAAYPDAIRDWVANGADSQANNLQPDNWTYKRQAWSLVGSERLEGERAGFNQGPLPGEEADWPFDSDFSTDVANLEPGQYYLDTLS